MVQKGKRMKRRTIVTVTSFVLLVLLATGVTSGAHAQSRHEARTISTGRTSQSVVFLSKRSEYGTSTLQRSDTRAGSSVSQRAKQRLQGQAMKAVDQQAVLEVRAEGSKDMRPSATPNWGVRGPQGPPGPPGPRGPAGPAGPRGVTGPAGPQGSAGAPGLPGQPGVTGPTGPTGPAGAPGPAGASGPAGAPGLAGPQGYMGVPAPLLGIASGDLSGTPLVSSNAPGTFTQSTGLMAVDDDFTTAWSSAINDPNPTITLNLGSTRNLYGAQLYWGDNTPRTFRIEVCNDVAAVAGPPASPAQYCEPGVGQNSQVAAPWTPVGNPYINDTNLSDLVAFPKTTAQYIRLVGMNTAGASYVLDEFEVVQY